MSEGNKDIAEYGKSTRFGAEGGADPKAARAKRTENGTGNQHTVRQAVRRLACADFDITAELTPKELCKKFGREGTVVTGAMLLAAKKFQKAMQGDVKMLQQITDDIDGKQVQKTIEAKTTLADLVNRSYEIEGKVEDDEPPRSSGE